MAPQDRSVDRHAKPARVIRPDPPELWDRLGEAVGERSRSAVISDLIRRYLDGLPMPKRPRAVSPPSHGPDRTGRTTRTKKTEPGP